MNANYHSRIILPLVLCLLCSMANAATYYVSTDGSDRNPGTLDKPFKSISKALKKVRPGDTCYLREGIYREGISLKSVNGGKSGITFAAYNGERVLIDGTVELTGQWERYKGDIFRKRIDFDIWQLFEDREMLMSARWPNGYWKDGSIWSWEKSWIKSSQESQYGKMKDAVLGELPYSLDGAIGIMNIGSFRTYQRFVRHEQGSDELYYPMDCWDRLKTDWFNKKNKEHGVYYFIEGKLELLDSPTEWFFDPKSQTVYVWLDDGKDPSDRIMRGKTLSYGIDLKKCSNIRIKGIDFFSATMQLVDCQNVTVEDCNFLYPSYSRRMVRDLKRWDITRITSKKPETPGHNTVRNCTFEYMDGPAMEVRGAYNTIENCYMHDIDYSCAYGGGRTLTANAAPHLLFRRNTIHTSGASECYSPGPSGITELNDLSRSGFLQNDGSLVQVSQNQQSGSFTRFNWVHDTVKQGLRFDNSNFPNSPYGRNGTMHHNVAWKTDRIFFKGEEHYIFNNLSFDSKQNDLIISSNQAIQGWNLKTVTRNNVCNKISGSRSKPRSKFPVPGIVDHNWAGAELGLDVRSQLRDPDNLDFRPRKDSALVDAGIPVKGKKVPFIGDAPDIGPYEFGDDHYWIPGYQSERASRPVPPDNGENVKTDADLMFLEGYKATSHHIYFGMSKEAVRSAGRTSDEYKGELQNNIFSPGELEPGSTGFWRIDTVRGNEVLKGDVWEFSVTDSVE